MTGQKPKRLYFETYMQLLRNSINTQMFQTFYVQNETGKQVDALAGGDNACAFYVSAVLTIFKKIQGVHGTVESTLKDLSESGWQLVEEPEPGDVLVWRAHDYDDGTHRHIGFYLGDGRAASTSMSKSVVIEHELHFGEEQRPLDQIWRCRTW